MSSLLVSRSEEKKKNRKTTLVVFFFSNVLSLTEKEKNREAILVVFSLSKMLSSIEEKKNRRAILVVLSLDRISSSLSSTLSLSSTSSFVISKSSLETQLSSSLSSFMLRDIAMMSEALVRNVVSSSESRRDEDFLAELIHSAISFFVLPSRSFFSVSLFFALLSFVSFVFLSSSDAPRLRKRARESSSPVPRKRAGSARNKCECIMSHK